MSAGKATSLGGRSAPTWQAIIARHVQAAHLKGGVYLASMADKAFLSYLDAVHDVHRTFHCSDVDGKSGPRLEQAMRTNRKAFKRWIDMQVSMPADMIQHVLEAMPEAYREPCQDELLNTLGLVPQRRSTGETIEALQALGHFLTNSGATINVWSQIMADGKLDHLDAPHKPEALHRLREIIGTAQAMIQLLEDHVPDPPQIVSLRGHN